ncbi:hypothetical protein Acr_07g0004210 [Actinidia rufa]|uniref:Uncharacterized protein n=1 Tax=Actinidia rufa TaxID=165716 RepID=A0A7J0EUQ7_9ERIC|nr:hypothetical protein Acr_07g0004210 [Actinidia rufa]
MDVLDVDDMKAEKASAMRWFNRLQTAARLFRLLEIWLALVLLSWISARLQFAVRISGEYFWKLIPVVVSPLFIFLLTNAIVITLLAKSGQTPAINNAETDLYNQFIVNTEETVNSEPGKSPPAPESEDISFTRTNRRSQSEKFEREYWEKPCERIRRSVTEKCQKAVDSGETMEDQAAHVVEELSNEEFKRTVEEFIAKQVRFHLEEKLVIVAC